jgi:hypothetical protein
MKSNISKCPNCRFELILYFNNPHVTQVQSYEKVTDDDTYEINNSREHTTKKKIALYVLKRMNPFNILWEMAIGK